MKQCLFCNNDFVPAKPKQIFCSNKCRVYFNRETVSDGGFVYCLRDPLNNNEIFYIGKTIVSLKKRITGHLSESKNKHDKKSSIIKNILDAGEDVIIEQIEVVYGDTIIETEKILKERETFWIKEFSKTQNLVNIVGKSTKTNPIGVRFRKDILELLKNKFAISSPQKALIFLERFYVTNSKLADDIGNVLKSEQVNIYNNITNPLSESECFTPKTLQELKDLCPKELTGLERSQWIANKRQEYGL